MKPIMLIAAAAQAGADLAVQHHVENGDPASCSRHAMQQQQQRRRIFSTLTSSMRKSRSTMNPVLRLDVVSQRLK
jgi:hypothetical protein